MPTDSKAQIFIKTLSEMLDDHREERSRFLREKLRLQAEWHGPAPRADFDVYPWPWVGALYRRRTVRVSTGTRRLG